MISDDYCKLHNVSPFRIVDEGINVCLSITALVCISVYPVEGQYSLDSVPVLLEILMCLNTARYCYRIAMSVVGSLVSVNKLKLLDLIHHVYALAFYVSILLTNENWWIGIIGNFIEMESLVLTTHYLLKQSYKAYNVIEPWCLVIQTVSALLVRLLLPVTLLGLFLPQLGSLHTVGASVALYLALVFFALYNLYVFLSRLRKQVCGGKRPRDRRTSGHRAAFSVPIQSICPDLKAASDWSYFANYWPSAKKQPTWSMVGLEEISTAGKTHTNSSSDFTEISEPIWWANQMGSKPLKSSLKTPASIDQQKTVRFVHNPTCVYSGTVAVLKPTSNQNTDSQAARQKDYTKSMIGKATSVQCVD